MKKLISLLLLSMACIIVSCQKDDPFVVNGLVLDKTALDLKKGLTETLKASVSPAGGNVTLKWTTSDPAVATVSDAGLVTAVKRGTATITVATPDGAKSATCAVKVLETKVYVVGSSIHEATGKSVASCWINNELQQYATTRYRSEANSVFVSGNDVYAAGVEVVSEDGHYVPVYWKNGQVLSLPLENVNEDAAGQSIYVAGGDVYVSGKENTGGKYDIAKYWKNGQAVNLTDGKSKADALSIFVVGTDVYVAGYRGNVALYWKNGEEVALTDGSVWSEAISIFVSGTDVYVAGFERIGLSGRIAVYWKNGKRITLTSGVTKATARSIFVAGNDVYVAGVEDNSNDIGVASYWKNEKKIAVSDGTTSDYISSIYVLGGNAYMAGNNHFWINDKQSTLSGKNSYGRSVFVTE